MAKVEVTLSPGFFRKGDGDQVQNMPELALLWAERDGGRDEEFVSTQLAIRRPGGM